MKNFYSWSDLTKNSLFASAIEYEATNKTCLIADFQCLIRYRHVHHWKHPNKYVLRSLTFKNSNFLELLLYLIFTISIINIRAVYFNHVANKLSTIWPRSVLSKWHCNKCRWRTYPGSPYGNDLLINLIKVWFVSYMIHSHVIYDIVGINVWSYEIFLSPRCLYLYNSGNVIISGWTSERRLGKNIIFQKR